MFHTKYDWQYYTQNDKRTSQAINDGRVYWPRAKMLGGSSNINIMLYFKGSKCDYWSWYNEGNKEWRPDILEECFKKAENLQNVNLLNNARVSDSYGHDGPLAINRFNNTNENITLGVLSAYEEVGFKNVPDLNTANVLGSGIMVGTAAKGRRSDTATSYLNPIKTRKNLSILKNTLVTKILIENQKAYGVKVERADGNTQHFYADKEVIVSGGSINTPQLLMLSGIGPQDHLKSHNIDVIADSPAVGQNLRDHIIVPVTVYADQPGFEDVAETNLEVIQYLYNRTGYLAHNSIFDVAAFYSLEKNATFPDFQTHLKIYKKQSSELEKYFENVSIWTPKARDPVLKLNRNSSLYMFMFNLLHPHSKGNITLSSSNPKEYPLIYANYFADERDLIKTAQGIRMLTKVVRTEFFKSINGKLGRIFFGPCNGFVLDSLAYWKCIARNFVTTVYHPMGTARMGTDPMTSVVDSRLRVHNIKNLRIIDASIMPSSVSSNTNGPVIMIGERGADLIKEDYKVR